MKMRDFNRLNRNILMQSHGTEDAAGRRLPSEIYRFLPRGPFRPRPSKADLRKQADAAIAEWMQRRRP